MPEAEENGIKWWIRNAIIPVLCGGGLLAFILGKSDHTSTPAPASNPSAGVESVNHPDEDAFEFYCSNIKTEHEERMIYTNGASMVFIGVQMIKLQNTRSFWFTSTTTDVLNADQYLQKGQ